MSDFTYYNANPDKQVLSDCVTRAITLASGLPYYTVVELLDLVSEHTGHNRISMASYAYLLEEVFKYPVVYPKAGTTVEQVIDKYSHNTLLIRMEGHLACSVAGILYDLFDSSMRDDVTCFWIAK